MLGLQPSFERFYEGYISNDTCAICCAVFVVWPKLPFKLIRFGSYYIPETIVRTIPRMLVWTLPKSIFVMFLRCLGFGRHGPERDSWASNYQRTQYGGYVPPGSQFARAQRYVTTAYRDHDVYGPRSEGSSWFWWSMRAFWAWGFTFFRAQAREAAARAQIEAGHYLLSQQLSSF